MHRITRETISLGLAPLFALSLAAGCDASAIDDDAAGSDKLSAGVVANPGTHDCDTLDYGIYWYGPGNVAQKYIPGTPNPFFDPTKPTVIQAHGWQNGSSKKARRETFNYLHNDAKNGVDVDLADAWIDAGWNIGYFYWNQFADEGEVKDAEAKIWSATAQRGMRWRRCDGSTTTAGAPNLSVGELFYDAYTAAMADFSGPSIRVVGHSLGNQLATRLAFLVHEGIERGELSPELLPHRVELLDPFWSNGGKSYLGNAWTGEVTRDIVATLIDQGVIFSRYKSSNINDFGVGDRNTSLTNMIGETELVPSFISSFDQAGRHVAAYNLYYHSFAFAPPTACDAACDEQAASASTGDARMRELMDEASRWIQSAGERTESPGDNVFRRR
ncbi:MAG: hypothetical protein Tsb0020_15960 [Haliangiales bacterium]